MWAVRPFLLMTLSCSPEGLTGSPWTTRSGCILSQEFWVFLEEGIFSFVNRSWKESYFPESSALLTSFFKHFVLVQDVLGLLGHFPILAQRRPAPEGPWSPEGEWA